MEQTPNARKNKRRKLKDLFKKIFQPKFWLLVGWVALIVGLIVYWSHVFTVQTERYTFIAQQVFNGLVFTAVVIQALIYHGQLQVMSVAFDPRLRITNVRVEDFEAGKRPVFIVSIINEGATDAKDVTLHIRVNLAEGNRLALKFSRPQVVTIPAGQKQDYFVPWRSPLPQERIDAFNKSVPLQVSGFFRLKDMEQKFCYRYYPWEGKRPEGVSQFIPCDFDPGLTTVVKLEGAEVKTAVGTLGVVIEKSTPEGVQPQKAAVPDRKDDQQNPA